MRTKPSRAELISLTPKSQVLTARGEAEHRPADLRAPLSASPVSRGPTMVDLVDRSVDREGVGDHPGAETAVGDVDVVVRSDVDGDGEVGRRELDDVDPPGWAGCADRPEHRHRTGAVGEQLVGVVPAGWSCALRRREGRVQLRHRGVEPCERSAALNTVTDGGHGAGGHRAQLDVDVGGIRAQQPAQRYDGGPGPVQLGLQSPQVTRDDIGALLRIVGGQDGLDLRQRHVELPEPVDDLRGRVSARARSTGSR